VTSETAVKAFHLVSRWTRLSWAWGLKFVKTRLLKHRLCKEQRNLDKRMSRLGAEFYSLYRQGETEFLKSLVVLQQLKIVEEAESRVFALLDRIDAVEQAYLSEKEAIVEKASKKE
jgi:hypothetical protein